MDDYIELLQTFVDETSETVGCFIHYLPYHHVNVFSDSIEMELYAIQESCSLIKASINLLLEKEFNNGK